MSNRAAIYARYSSENQRDASIEDQVRLCRARAEREGWKVINVYTDHAISGATVLRPGYQQMLADARRGDFDIIAAEALDRISRDQEHVAAFYKQMSFAGVRVITLSEGEIGELHVGLKGTMNALFLKDLAAKSLRGQIGKAHAGLAAGGIPYGYEVIREFGPDGELVRGRRRVVEAEAIVIRRIFGEFAAGRSSVAIAKRLNAEGVPAPRGGSWNPSTIHGHRGRGVGLLTNPLYVGKQLFNRHRFARDPDSGSRRARMKDKSEWVETAVPELAIVDPALWQQVQDRLAAIPPGRPERHRRPKRLFSGLIVCGVCGGQITIAYGDRYGCSACRTKGICSNNRTMGAPLLEKRVLDALRDKLLSPKLVEAFVGEYRAELRRLNGDERRRRQLLAQERTSLEQQIARLVDAIATGGMKDIGAIGERLRALESRLAEIGAPLDEVPETVEIHPNAVELYRRKIADMANALNADDLVRDEAISLFRGLIDKIVAYPSEKRGQFDLELHGRLAAILNAGKPGNGGGKPGTSGGKHGNGGGGRSHGRTGLCHSLVTGKRSGNS